MATVDLILAEGAAGPSRVEGARVQYVRPDEKLGSGLRLVEGAVAVIGVGGGAISAGFWQEVVKICGEMAADGVAIVFPTDPVAISTWKRLEASGSAAARLVAARFGVFVCERQIFPSIEAFDFESLLNWGAKKQGLRCEAVPMTEVSRESFLALAEQRASIVPGWCQQAAREYVCSSDGGSSGAAATAVRAGLLLLHDLLDEGHAQAQMYEGEGDCDYWHAIMHRREPDYGNAKYWWHRVGRHACFRTLASELRRDGKILAELGTEWSGRIVRGEEWNPGAFTDLCSALESSERNTRELAARRIQELESLLLLAHCVERAK